MKKDDLSEDTIFLLSISQEDITLIKKFMISGGKMEEGQKAIPFYHKKAVQKGKQFVLSVPAFLVEEIKQNYFEALRNQETSKEGGIPNEQHRSSH